MNQKLQPGVVIHLLLEWLMGVMGVLGSVLCLCTVESFGFSAPPALFFVIPVLMLGFCLLFRQRRGGLYGGMIGILLVLLCVLLRRAVIPGAVTLWNCLANHYANTYDAVRLIHPRQIPVDPLDAGPAILTLGVLQTWLCALSISRWRKTLPAALTLALGVVPCYVALQTMPALPPLMLVVLSVLLQILTQNIRRREPRETGKAFVWALVVAVLVLGCLVSVIPREKYEPPLTWDELAEQLQQIGAELNNRGNVDAGLSGNPDEVDFSRLRSLPTRPKKVMEVTADYTGVCYLRGSAYSGFNGNGWFRDETQAWSAQAVFPYLNSGLSAHTVRVKTEETEKLIYTGYEMLRLPQPGTLHADAWYSNDGKQTEYTLQLTLMGDDESPNPGPEYEAWVLEHCTELPDRTKQGLLEWWAQQTGGISAASSVDAVAQQVAELISQCAEYDRSPDLQPQGSDFCTWFINDASTGYCVHFATSAAAMLRALGIPSRYISGYIVQTTANTPTEVTTIHAHAWAEYYSGGRWHLLEATPSEATEFTGLMPGMQEATLPQQPQERPEYTRPTTPLTPVTETEFTPTRPERHTDAVQETEARTQGHTQSTPGRNGDKEFPKWLWIPIGLAGLILLAVLRRMLVNRRREKRLARSQSNDRARLLFHRYRRLCRLVGEEPDAEAVSLAKKAVFSQHRIQQEELDYLRQCVEHQIARAESAGFWKRMYYRYILSMI